MSYHRMIIPDKGAGRLIEVFNAILLLNSYWSRVDDETNGMPTNEAVYRCYDPSGVANYYMRIKNNQSAYADIELWEGWDPVTHAGVGAFVAYNGASSSYLARIWYDLCIEIQLRNFRFSMLVPAHQNHYYVGRPDELFDETKNIVIMIVRSTSTSVNNNPMGTGIFANNTVNGVTRFLFDEDGNQRYLSLSQMICPETINGSFLLEKTRIRNATTFKAVGYIHDNMSCGVHIPGVFWNQIRYDSDGNAWKAIGNNSTSSYNSFIKMA